MSLLNIFSLQIVQVAMSDSLFKKYPHLQTLVSEDDQHVSDQSSVRGESSRRSLLGPGVGPRKDLQTLAPVRSESKPPATAVDLFARSMKADKDDWLDFTIQESLSARQHAKVRTHQFLVPMKVLLFQMHPKQKRKCKISSLEIINKNSGILLTYLVNLKPAPSSGHLLHCAKNCEDKSAIDGIMRIMFALFTVRSC